MGRPQPRDLTEWIADRPPDTDRWRVEVGERGSMRAVEEVETEPIEPDEEGKWSRSAEDCKALADRLIAIAADADPEALCIRVYARAGMKTRGSWTKTTPSDSAPANDGSVKAMAQGMIAAMSENIRSVEVLNSTVHELLSVIVARETEIDTARRNSIEAESLAESALAALGEDPSSIGNESTRGLLDRVLQGILAKVQSGKNGAPPPPPDAPLSDEDVAEFVGGMSPDQVERVIRKVKGNAAIRDAFLRAMQDGEDGTP